MPETVVDPPDPFCSILLSETEIPKSQSLGPDPFLPRAREARRDQDQAIEISGFRFRKAGWSRTDQADRQRFPASATFQWRNFGRQARIVCSGYVLVKRHRSDAAGIQSTGDPRASRPIGLCADIEGNHRASDGPIRVRERLSRLETHAVGPAYTDYRRRQHCLYFPAAPTGARIVTSQLSLYL